MAYTNARHIYRITFNNNTTRDVYSKKDLELHLMTAKAIKVEKYKANGIWTDLTSKYIK